MSEALFETEWNRVERAAREEIASGHLRVSGGVTPAEVDPVAEVILDGSVPHLARPFDYAVPAGLDAVARPGVRVRVRFAGRLVGGYLLRRKAETRVDGELAALGRVVSPVPVLTPETLRLCEAVAERYAGVLPDVLRLAVPPRHARTEASEFSSLGPVPEAWPAGLPGVAEAAREAARLAPLPDSHEATPGAESFLTALRSALESGEPGPRAASIVLPGHRPGASWTSLATAALARAVHAGRSVLVVVPDYRDLAEIERELGPLKGHWASLAASQGPAARYRAFLAALSGRARVVVGTRAAAFAPLEDLGLVVLYDDGNDNLLEQRAPYPHAREVLLTRVRQSGAALLMLDAGRSVETQRLVETGWLRDIGPSRAQRREGAPAVAIPRDAEEIPSRLPSLAFAAVRRGLGKDKKHPREGGPVLVQVPRAGYQPALACSRCRARALCRECGRGLARRTAGGPVLCDRGHETTAFRCPHCSGTGLRAITTGASRTFEEIGRAFPGVPVVRSGGESVLHRVERRTVIVVATVGAEPLVEGGYRAAVLMDGGTLISLPGLRATEHAVARWFRAASLVAGAEDGGEVVLVSDEPATSGALVRWDPEGYASRELAERTELHLPPAARMAQLRGGRAAVAQMLAAVQETLGEAGPELLVSSPLEVRPGDAEAGVVVTARFPLRGADRVTRALRAVTVARSARKDDSVVHVRVDDPAGL